MDEPLSGQDELGIPSITRDLTDKYSQLKFDASAADVSNVASRPCS